MIQEAFESDEKVEDLAGCSIYIDMRLSEHGGKASGSVAGAAVVA